MRRLVPLFALVFAGAPAAADEAPKLSAEQRVLDHMVGTWEEVMSNKEAEWTPTAGTAKSVTTRAWALGGKFTRASGTWESAKIEFLHLMSYDEHAKVYRSWYFDAGGNMPRSMLAGTWDEKTRTLTFHDKDDAGHTTVGTHTFVDKDHREWTVVTKNADGKVMLDMAGKCVRRKE